MSVEHNMRKLQSINTIKSAATEIRNSLKECTFNLKNKFCDPEEPKSSWNNAQIPTNGFTSSAAVLISLSHMQLSNF